MGGGGGKGKYFLMHSWNLRNGKIKPLFSHWDSGSKLRSQSRLRSPRDGHCTHPKQPLLQELGIAVTSGRISACSVMARQSSHPHRETLLSPKHGTRLPIGNGPSPILMSKLELCPHNAWKRVSWPQPKPCQEAILPIQLSGWLGWVCAQTLLVWAV